MKLEGKVAIVTGGSQGIGRAVAKGYAREGAKVAVVNAGNPERGQEVADEIEAEGGTACSIRADVTSKAERRLARRAGRRPLRDRRHPVPRPPG